jgi:predicted dehydrogenase
MIAEVHKRAVAASGAQLRGILGSNAARTNSAATAWGTAAYDSLSAILASRDVDVVHICTPNALHYEMASDALRAGKHVVCEKPLATELAHALELSELAETTGRIATVPFVYRYHPMVREARAKVQSGQIGKVKLVHGSYLQDWLLEANDSNWRVDAGLGGASRAFGDIGSHWCDLVEWVTGERFASTVALLSTAQTQRPAAGQATFTQGADSAEKIAVATEDIACALFKTDSGVAANLTISQVSAGRKNRLWFEIDGEAASLTFDQETPDQLWMGQRESTSLLVKDPGQGSAEQRRLAILPAGHAQGYNECFAAFVSDTYARIRGESPEGLPTFADGLRSAYLIQAVLESHRDHRWTTIGPVV